MVRKFKVDFLENKASNEKLLFYIFDFLFRVESPPFHLYRQLPTTLYIILWYTNTHLCPHCMCYIKHSEISLHTILSIKILQFSKYCYANHVFAGDTALGRTKFNLSSRTCNTSGQARASSTSLKLTACTQTWLERIMFFSEKRRLPEWYIQIFTLLGAFFSTVRTFWNEGRRVSVSIFLHQLSAHFAKVLPSSTWNEITSLNGISINLLGLLLVWLLYDKSYKYLFRVVS